MSTSECEQNPTDLFKSNGLIEMQCPNCSAISQLRLSGGLKKFLSDCPSCNSELKVQPVLHFERANCVELELQITVISVVESKLKLKAV